MSARLASIRRLAARPSEVSLPTLPTRYRSFSHSAALRSNTEPNADDALLASLKTALKESMRSKDTLTSTVLRSILSDHQYALKSSSSSPTSTDALLPSLLQKSLARRIDAATQFRTAARPDLAAQEDAEAAVVRRFLPAQLSEAEIEAVAHEVVAKLVDDGAVTSGKATRAMGAVRRVRERCAPGSVDGKVVSEVCRRVLERV